MKASIPLNVAMIYVYGTKTTKEKGDKLDFMEI